MCIEYFKMNEARVVCSRFGNNGMSGLFDRTRINQSITLANGSCGRGESALQLLLRMYYDTVGTVSFNQIATMNE